MLKNYNCNKNVALRISPLRHISKYHQKVCYNTEGHLIFPEPTNNKKLNVFFYIQINCNTQRKEKWKLTYEALFFNTCITWRIVFSQDEQFVLKVSVSHCSTVVPRRQTPNQLIHWRNNNFVWIIKLKLSIVWLAPRSKWEHCNSPDEIANVVVYCWPLQRFLSGYWPERATPIQ